MMDVSIFETNILGFPVLVWFWFGVTLYFSWQLMAIFDALLSRYDDK